MCLTLLIKEISAVCENLDKMVSKVYNFQDFLVKG